MTRALLRFAFVGFLGVGCIGAQADETAAAPQGPSLGLLLERPSVADVDALPAPEQGRPVYARLQADWAEIERGAGVYDWSALEPVVSGLERAGYRVVLGLTGSNPRYLTGGEALPPAAGESLQAWLDFVRSAVRVFAGAVETVEIWSGGEGEGAPCWTVFEPADYAFLLKNSALAARAEARAIGAEIRVAQCPVSPAASDWQRRLWEEDSAAYVDILPIGLDPGAGPEGTGQGLANLLRESLLHPPAAELWAYAWPRGGNDPWDTIAVGVEALASGAAVALIDLDGAERLAAEQARWALGADRLLATGYAPAPLGKLRFIDEDGGELNEGRVLGRFFGERDFSTLIFYELEGPPGELPRDKLIVDSPLVRNPTILDPMSGRILRVSSAPVEGRGGERSIRVAGGDHPQALIYRRVVSTEGFELPPEEVQTTRGRELTAEEIIARNQQVQKIQDDALERWTAQARIDFHFKFAMGGPTIDVGIDSNYFWERGGQIEWEQTDYYIQGNKVTWKNIPELPYIQPEKVVTLPLDLTLDKTYAYRLVGSDRVRGREAYVLAFEPAEPDAAASLYAGRVWIDRESFVRLKVSLVQSGLEAPVLSNEERDLYGPQTGADGMDYWLLDRIDGQQLWTIGGRNLVVRREVTFLAYQVNPPIAVFEARRREAYASRNQMLRDTEDGYRYLERQEDGSRNVKQEMDSSQLFAAVGAFQDDSTDGVIPLAGVNWFDYDLFGRNIQLNVLFAGVLGFVNASKPDLFGGNADLTLDAVGVAIKTDDKVFSGDEELLLERIRTRGQNLSLRLGKPLGQFFKVTLVGSLGFNSYDSSSDAETAYDEIRENPELPYDLRFVLPPDHTLLTGSVQAEFNRRGYTVGLVGSHSRRSDWAAWGLYDDTSGSFVSCDEATLSCEPREAEPAGSGFTKWGATIFKEWYLPAFQKLRGEIDYLDGTDLDRFSRYEFSFFGDDRLNGYSGSGVRFDRGGIVRAEYAFNLFEAIRFSASLENARVEIKDSGEGFRSFTGLGLSGNVVGPWKTVVSLSWGYALASDIPDLEGQQEFYLLVLKLF